MATQYSKRAEIKPILNKGTEGEASNRFESLVRHVTDLNVSPVYAFSKSVARQLASYSCTIAEYETDASDTSVYFWL